MFRTLCIALLLLLATHVHAGGIEKLKQFIGATRAGQATFSQVVLDQNGRRMQSASGVMQFMRPGKFRWAYAQPYEQLIVGDGRKFWLYDVDLNQVTVRSLDAALGSSPAALLSGSNEIERSFVLGEHGSQNGLDWLEALPRASDSSFRRIRMAFDAQANLQVMELLDLFGNTTVLRFSALKRNPVLAPGLFKFEPPAGVDVLSE